ncbi:hypothetical protein Bpfe_022141, partial [Biomphalaria pfeifferi]
SRHRINLKEENYNRIDVTQVDPAVYEQHNDQGCSLPHMSLSVKFKHLYGDFIVPDLRSGMGWNEYFRALEMCLSLN